MRKRICVDFDGVIAWDSGWKGGDHFGDPIPGVKEFLAKLREKYEVIVFTCRCCEDAMRGIEKAHLLANRVRDYMDSHELPYDEIYTGQGKPVASYYVDDRGVRCLPQLDNEAYDRVLEVVLEDDYIPMASSD